MISHFKNPEYYKNKKKMDFKPLDNKKHDDKKEDLSADSNNESSEVTNPAPIWRKSNK